jgi:hypothetical protein
MNARTWLLITLIALTLGACQQPAAPLASRPWTMFDLQAAYDVEGAKVLEGVEGFPQGFPPSAFIKSRQPVIPISPAFTEEGFSPYITTNLWANFPEVWIQPMYILVTDWDPETHDWKRLGNAPWIYTVGETSRFHSPFWRVYYAKVPADATASTYTSSEQILRDKLPLYPGPGRLVSIVPNGTVLGAPPGPFEIPGFVPPRIRTADYLDGRVVTAIDFGNNRFDWNEKLEVIEEPLFVLVTCSSATECGPSSAPSIGGTGPLFARRPPILPGGRPRFGSFWRLYFVTLPAGDDVGLFIPPSADAESRSKVANGLSGLAAPMPGFTPAAGEEEAAVNKRFMQVALNARECFASAEAFKDCKWLDSQQAIEELLPQAIKRTGITVTCPFVAYDGKDVKE